MRRVWVAATLAALGLSCGPFRGAGPCCTPTVLARDQAYEGATLDDGGVRTRVVLNVTSSGEARLTFFRDGNVIEERFTATGSP